MTTTSDTPGGDGEDFTPPVHLGQLYRASYDRRHSSLVYQVLGTSTRYRLLIDGSYNLAWIRKDGYKNTRARPRPSKCVYPEGEDQADGVSIESFDEACKLLVDWLRENVTKFETPPEVNGWQIVDDAIGIEYTNPGGTGLVYYDFHGTETFSARAQPDVGDIVTIASHVDTRAEAVNAMLEWMQSTDPDGWGHSAADQQVRGPPV